MTTRSRYQLRTCRSIKNRIAALLLAMCPLLISLGWTGQALAQATLPRVGILTFSAADTDDAWWNTLMETFRRTLADRGWVEGKTVSLEYRSANGDPTRFAAAAEELVALDVDVIYAAGAPAVRAAFAASRTIPIVTGDYTTDPIAEGYVQTYARPGGNITGVFLDAPELTGKWLELLTEMIPSLSRIAVLWDPGPGTAHLQALRSITASFGMTLQVIEVRKAADVKKAFAALRDRPQAVIILPSPMIYQQSARFAGLALQHRLPATAFAREFALAGGVLSYGPDEPSTFDRTAVLVAKILGGSSPAELPIERPAKIQLVVNLKTAKELGITIPQSILLRADEVIR